VDSERLRRKIELVRPALAAAGRRFLDHPNIGRMYAEYLFVLHCIVRASVPLMRTALDLSRTLAQSDRVAAGMVPYLENHILEELHHDEWLLDDLGVIGVRQSEVLSRPPSPTVASLVGAQYYWVRHSHPVALMGYMAVLEGYPPSTHWIEALVAATGHPGEAFRTLREHAELDPGHWQELAATLDALPLTDDHRAVLGLSAIHTVRMVAQAIDELVEDGDAHPIVQRRVRES
jgi:pyrroloquinoline quinone (PQQ) biosynthesis protein C